MRKLEAENEMDIQHLREEERKCTKYLAVKDNIHLFIYFVRYLSQGIFAFHSRLTLVAKVLSELLIYKNALSMPSGWKRARKRQRKVWVGGGGGGAIGSRRPSNRRWKSESGWPLPLVITFRSNWNDIKANMSVVRAVTIVSALLVSSKKKKRRVEQMERGLKSSSVNRDREVSP